MTTSQLTMSNKELDNLNYKAFKKLSKLLKAIKSDIEEEKSKLINLCNSKNNSKPVNKAIEDITNFRLIRSLEEGVKPYLGIHTADHNFEFPNYILCLDNKGVQMKYREKELTKTELIEICKDHNLNFEKKTKKILLKLVIEHNICPDNYIVRKNKIYKKLEERKEMFNDHLDGNLHFKEPQTNIKTFFGKHKKKEVKFEGKLPEYVDGKPVFSFILKHVYNVEEGITKLVLYSIPHNQLIKKYSDIQSEKDTMRAPKSKDEFRFNMNDRNGNPYKFLNGEERYVVINL